MVILMKMIHHRYWLVIIPVLCAMALPFTTLAQSGDTPRPAPVVLTDSQDKYPLGLHLELLEDPTGQLTIEDVSSSAYYDQFIPSQAAVPNFGYTSAAIWARFQVRNQASLADTWRLAIAEARLGYVDLYLPAVDGTDWIHQQAGRSRPFTVREVAYRYGVFNLPLPPDQDQAVYLRFQGTSPVLLPLTLWSVEAFSSHAQAELLVFGLFYGAMLVMLGYNLFLFVSLRDRSYLYLAFFITCFGLNDAFREGLVQQYLGPEWPNQYGIWFAATLTYITALLFGASFLQTKIRTPWLHKVMMVVIFIALLTFTFNYVLGWFFEAHTILALLAALLLVAAGYLTWRQGYRPARYFLLAWLLFLGAAIFHNLTNGGLLPGTPFGQHSMRLGMALMVLLLSLALADRINLFKAETAASERRLNQFLEAMPVGVTVYDAATRLGFVSRHARALFNLSPDSTSSTSGPTLAQTNARFPFFVAGSEQPYPLEQLPVSRALQTGRPASADDIEVHTRPLPIQLEVWASPIFDEQGRLQYAIAAFQDITQRKQMETELRRHRDHLEELVAERTGQLSAFLDMTMLVSEARTLPQVLDVAVNRIMEFCHCQTLLLHLLDDDQSTLNLLTQRGVTLAQQEQFQTIPLEPPLSDWLLQRQEPLLALDPDKVAFLPMSLRLDDCRAYIGVQLRAREQILGMLSYFRFTEEMFSLDEVSLLVALAEQLGIIIENHRLRDQIQENAVVAERHRLARDLHDSITQSLYSINLFAHAVRQAAEIGDAERLDNSINRVEAISQTALKEMRLLLYQLRPPLLTEKSLAEVLQLRFDSVERRLGIEVDYQVEGSFDLPSKIAEEVYWVAIETLNNSLKHAEASRVTVQLAMDVPTIALKIVDNGRGFDPDRVNGGMGLQNIRERLEQLDGCLTIKSAPGAGTTTAITVNVAGGPDN